MKLISKTLCRTSFIAATVITALSIATQTNAADPVQCKGLENAACMSQDSCSWVNGYERKDGKTVSAFCRSKAKQKTTNTTTSQPSDKAS